MGISAQQWNDARTADMKRRQELRSTVRRQAEVLNNAILAQEMADQRRYERIHAVQTQPFTYLQLACRAGDLAKVKQALDMGLSVHTPGPFGWTALHIAAMAYASTAADSRQATLNTIAELLLQAGADVTARDAMGLTPMACSNGLVPPAIRKAALAAFKPEPDLVCERESCARERKYRVLD